MKHVGFWNGGKHESIEMVEVDGTIYALNGWNGEKYLDCWKCIDERTVDPAEPGSFAAKPIHRFEVEEIDLDTLDENSKEWESAVEIIDYYIAR